MLQNSSVIGADAKFLNDLPLSARRGPEAELYDVAGDHLLSSFINPCNVVPISTPCCPCGKSPALLTKCWNYLIQYDTDEDLPIIPCGSNNVSLGKPSIKGILHNGTIRSHFPTCCPRVNPDVSSNRATSLIRRIARRFLCSASNDMSSVPTGRISHGYFRHMFSLCYRRYELCTLLFLLCVVALVQAGDEILRKRHIVLSTESFLFGFSVVELGRLAVNLIASLLSVACLLVLTSACTKPNLRIHVTPNEVLSTETETAENSRDSGKQATCLFAAQQISRLLQLVHIVTFVICILLTIGCLLYPEVFHKGQTHYLLLNQTRALICDRPSNNGSDTVPATELTVDVSSNPSPHLWVVLWLVVAVHGLFDVNRFNGPRWNYALTVALCAGYLILVNVDYFRVDPFVETPSFVACMQASEEHVPYSQSFWDSHGMVAFRMNTMLVLSFAAAHLLGRLLTAWTVSHRYRLFLTTLRGQNKLTRLSVIETKLHELASTMVPISLAQELSRDFVAGYLAWRSPLVIYLRNISFLSAEVVGLNHVATCAAVSLATTKLLISVVNDLFCAFDRLAKRERCYRARLNGCELFYIAGYPDSRVDHARSCVELGLSMLKLVKDISAAANIAIELKVGVHTGTAYAAVLGHSRLGFELIGDDVHFTDCLRQTAVRPGRVLVSWATFNQLPEGFRGEAGPVLHYSRSTSEHSHSVDSYFVQPRHGETTVDASETLSTDWPTLCEFDPTTLLQLNQLASAVSATCRQDKSARHTPLDLMFPQSEDNLVSHLRSSLAQALSELVQHPDSHLTDLPRREHSACEQLAWTAVTKTHPCDEDRTIPCQHRAGRLRTRRSNGAVDPADTIPLTCVAPYPSQSSDLPDFLKDSHDQPMIYAANCYMPVSPPGCSSPSWCTLNMEPRASPADQEFELAADAWISVSLVPNRIARIWLFMLIVLLPVTILMSVIHLLAVSRSFWLLFTFACVLLWFAFVSVVGTLIKRLLWSTGSRFNALCVGATIVSVLIVTAACSTTVSLCQPATLLNLHGNRNDSFPPNSITFSKTTTTRTSASQPLCFTPSHFMLIAVFGSLLPALGFHALMFTVSMSKLTDAPMTSHVYSQPVRFCLGFGIFIVYGAIYVWLTFTQGLDNTVQLNSRSGLRFDLSEAHMGHTLFGLLAFSILGFVLPRSIHLQSIIMRQWLFQIEDTKQKLCHSWTALTRLLLSLAPPHALLSLLQQSKPIELYANNESVIGLILIYLMANSCQDAPCETANKDADDPSQIADRLRLTNHVIGVIDQLAEGRLVETGCSRDNHRVKARFCKIYVSGTCVGYSVGCVDTDKLNTHAQQVAGFNQLLTFAERVVEACEYVNNKTKSTNNLVHARIAIHAGSGVTGLVCKDRPAFTFFGDPLHVCLYLIQESNVPALSQQHLLLATDDVVSMIPGERIDSSSAAGHRLTWRCVDTCTGAVIPSSQVRRLSDLGQSNRPLHFCSLSTEQPNNGACENSALITLVKKASTRTPAQCLRAQHAVSKAKTSSPETGSRLVEPNINPPPPPPPHHRAYSTAKTAEALTRASVIANNDVLANPVVAKPHNEATSSMAKRSNKGRREVISQCVPHRHDYSIVNVEPIGPNLNHLLKPRPRTQLINAGDAGLIVNQFAEYWPNVKSTTAETETSRTDMVALNGHPLKNGTVTQPGSSASSSTDSFLLAEKACAADVAAQLIKNPPASVEAVSHHNPLYTDTEYDSMTESQIDLILDHTARPPQVPPHTIKGATFSNDYATHMNGCPRRMTSGNHYDVCPVDFDKTESRSNGLMHSVASDAVHHRHQAFNFPDIRRPHSPVYCRNEPYRTPRIESPYVCGSPMYVPDHSQTRIPHPQMALSAYSSSRMDRSRYSDYNALSFRCSVNVAAPSSADQSDIMPSSIRKKGAPQSEGGSSDESESAEPGSLGPMSLVVQPSSGALTSCDEDGDEFAARLEGIPFVTCLPAPACMTDSLMATSDAGQLDLNGTGLQFTRAVPSMSQAYRQSDRTNVCGKRLLCPPPISSHTPYNLLPTEYTRSCALRFPPPPAAENSTLPAVAPVGYPNFITNPEYDNLFSSSFLHAPAANTLSPGMTVDVSYLELDSSPISGEIGPTGDHESVFNPYGKLSNTTSSVASASDPQRSEYDNVNRSTSCSTNASPSPVRAPRVKSRKRMKHRRTKLRAVKRMQSDGVRALLNRGNRVACNAQIIAEAQRISEQFRVHNGSVSKLGRHKLATERDSPTSTPSVVDRGTFMTIPGATRRDLIVDDASEGPSPRTQSYSLNRVTSGHSSWSCSSAECETRTQANHLNVARPRRAKSSRYTKPTEHTRLDSPRFQRLQRRAARVRSLIPTNLQPFILPSCMSSLSHSSNGSSPRPVVRVSCPQIKRSASDPAIHSREIEHQRG